MSDLADIAARLEVLEQEHANTKAERDAYHALYLEMLERCRKLELGLRGQKSERVASEAQLSFSMLEMMLSEDGRVDLAELDKATRQVRAHERAKPTGRTPLPEHLPRVDIEIVPDEVKRLGLDAFDKIGEDVTEIIERRPASLVVARVIKPKFVRKDRERGAATAVFVGGTPPLPLERGKAGPGMLADTIVRRWQDHQPLTRLEGIYARDGLALSKQTMSDWHIELTDLVDPLIAAMRADAFAQPFLCTDATGVLVQAKKRCVNSHFLGAGRTRQTRPLRVHEETRRRCRRFGPCRL